MKFLIAGILLLGLSSCDKFAKAVEKKTQMLGKAANTAKYAEEMTKYNECLTMAAVDSQPTTVCDKLKESFSQTTRDLLDQKAKAAANETASAATNADTAAATTATK
jgi:phage-related tail protein